MGFTNPMLQPEGPERPERNDWAAERAEIENREHRAGTRALWAFITMVALGLAVSAYYGYSVVKKQNIQIGQVFGSQGTIGQLAQRADSAESRMRELSQNWDGVGQRVAKLETKFQSEMKQTRRYAETLNQQLHQQITAELDARTSTLDARLHQVESEQSAEHEQIAQVEANLARQMKSEIASAQEATNRDLSGVREQADANSHDVDALSQSLKKERVDFELTKGQTKELIPGVTLKISKTNPLYQRYRGSLWLLQDRRTLWLKDQGVHEPVRFFHKDGGDAYELVVTDVTQKAAIGYLLVPAETAAPNQRAALDASDHK